MAQPMEVATVEAARSAKVAQSTHGVPIEEITIRSRVSYADLDLTTAAGATKLDQRIRDTATSACREMDVKFPAERSSVASCIKDAVDSAMTEAHKIINAKRAAGKPK
jgi:UrcA family protein